MINVLPSYSKEQKNRWDKGRRAQGSEAFTARAYLLEWSFQNLKDELNKIERLT